MDKTNLHTHKEQEDSITKRVPGKKEIEKQQHNSKKRRESKETEETTHHLHFASARSSSPIMFVRSFYFIFFDLCSSQPRVWIANDADQQSSWKRSNSDGLVKHFICTGGKIYYWSDFNDSEPYGWPAWELISSQLCHPNKREEKRTK